ncbi:MAG: nucleotidyltransferase domain-containing protein [Acidobacteria bacterium]|nr:nucleotidyltransferase domain-containing protein [Acidobacteriota bacterium]
MSTLSNIRVRQEVALERLGDRFDAIGELCDRHGIVRLHVFGSLLTQAFSPSSDIDLIATFVPGGVPSIFEHMRIEEEFAGLLGRPVDLLTRGAVDAAKNALLRDEIQGSEVLVYARQA